MKEAEEIQKKCRWKFSWRITAENFVFYDGGNYYKMPTFLAKNTMYRKVKSYEKVCNSLITIKKYFWPLTKIPTTVILRDKKWHYVIKQKSINGKKLTKKILKNNPTILSKFKRLIIANEIMRRKEGVFLDLLGSEFLTSPQTIHNLLTDEKEIYVFDFWLLEWKSKNMFFWYFSHFAQKINLFFAKYFF